MRGETSPLMTSMQCDNVQALRHLKREHKSKRRRLRNPICASTPALQSMDARHDEVSDRNEMNLQRKRCLQSRPFLRLQEEDEQRTHASLNYICRNNHNRQVNAYFDNV